MINDVQNKRTLLTSPLWPGPDSQQPLMCAYRFVLCISVNNRWWLPLWWSCSLVDDSPPPPPRSPYDNLWAIMDILPQCWCSFLQYESSGRNNKRSRITVRRAVELYATVTAWQPGTDACKTVLIIMMARKWIIIIYAAGSTPNTGCGGQDKAGRAGTHLLWSSTIQL